MLYDTRVKTDLCSRRVLVCDRFSMFRPRVNIALVLTFQLIITLEVKVWYFLVWFMIRGRIPHTEVYRLMCDMSPPVGFGRKCPKFIAYKVSISTTHL